MRAGRVQSSCLLDMHNVNIKCMWLAIGPAQSALRTDISGHFVCIPCRYDWEILHQFVLSFYFRCCTTARYPVKNMSYQNDTGSIIFRISGKLLSFKKSPRRAVLFDTLYRWAGIPGFTSDQNSLLWNLFPLLKSRLKNDASHSDIHNIFLLVAVGKAIHAVLISPQSFDLNPLTSKDVDSPGKVRNGLLVRSNVANFNAAYLSKL